MSDEYQEICAVKNRISISAKKWKPFASSQQRDYQSIRSRKIVTHRLENEVRETKSTNISIWFLDQGKFIISIACSTFVHESNNVGYEAAYKKLLSAGSGVSREVWVSVKNFKSILLFS